MSRIYIFAIGGTGVRVLRSLTMLAASGQMADKEIVPIIIDFDVANGNLRQTVNTLQKYRDIREALLPGINNQIDGFFSTSIQTVTKLAQTEEDSFLIKFRPPSNEIFSAAEMLGYEELEMDNIESRKLINSLLNIDQLHNNLNIGFGGKGNIAHIAIRAMDIKSNTNYKYFERSFYPPQDKVVIISSTFSTTGTTLTCEILRLLENDLPELHAGVAVCLLEPYFSVNKNPQKFIEMMWKNSDCFCNYYKGTNLNEKVDETFFINSNNSIAFPYEYHECSENQLNPANLTELYAAMTIVNFCNNVKQSNSINVPNSFNINNYTDGKTCPFIESLATMSLMVKWIELNRNGKFFRVLQHIIEDTNFDDQTLLTLVDNFSKLYKDWCEELSDSNPNSPMTLFDFETDDISYLIRGRKPNQYSFFARFSHFSFANKELNRFINMEIIRLYENEKQKQDMHNYKANKQKDELLLLQSLYKVTHSSAVNILKENNQ